MNGLHVAFLLLMTLLAGTAFGKEPQEKDVFPTGAGDLTVTFLGHGSLLFSFDGTTIAIDPFAKVADYGTLPKADIILVTHEHDDHLDPGAIQATRSDRTVVAANPAAAARIPGALAPEMVADAARVLRPKILYPYHFGETDTSRVVDLLRSRKETEVRIRRMQ